MDIEEGLSRETSLRLESIDAKERSTWSGSGALLQFSHSRRPTSPDPPKRIAESQVTGLLILMWRPKRRATLKHRRAPH
jgi:hypothetical protein